MTGAPAPALAAGAGTAGASAPAKVVLLGEHAVNRGGRALATAIGLRVRCRVRLRTDGRVALRSGAHACEVGLGELRAEAARVEAARERGDLATVAAHATDFLAPARHVLAGLPEHLLADGLDAAWEDGLPVGAGLGSGAAAHCALAVAVARAAGAPLDPARVAALAWRGDVVAHGGIASALDASASAHGGVVAYEVASGARPVPCPAPLPLVVADTGVVAPTSAVNAGVQARLRADPGLAGVFDELAVLVEAAEVALAAGDLPALGRLMHADQLLLERLGVSTPAIERLVAAALAAGAHGAKLSGSGGGGIVVALAPPDGVAAVTAALHRAGGRPFAAAAAVPGAHPDPPTKETP